MSCPCTQMAGKDIELSPICIGQFWLFKDLGTREREALSREALRKKMKKGDILFHQGDPADEMFLIKGGRIRLMKIFEDGRELTLDIRKAGDFVGESMFSDKIRYPVTAISLEDTLTCGFSRHQFEKLVIQHPDIGLKIIRNLSERISWLTERVGDFTISNIEERLFSVLCNVAHQHGTKSTRGFVIQFPLTHEDLSFLTGAHRVSITRAMKGLREAGKIIHQGKTLILPSLNGSAPKI